MLLSEVFKSSIRHGKLPILSLQHGCLSLAVVGRWLDGETATYKWRPQLGCTYKYLFNVLGLKYTSQVFIAKFRDFLSFHLTKLLNLVFHTLQQCDEPSLASLSFNNATHRSPPNEIFFYNINHMSNLIFSTDKSPRMNNTKWKQSCSSIHFSYFILPSL